MFDILDVTCSAKRQNWCPTTRPPTQSVDMWRTACHRPLVGADAAAEWFEGSGLRRFLTPLNDAEGGTYLSQYRAATVAVYPTSPETTP